MVKSDRRGLILTKPKKKKKKKTTSTPPLTSRCPAATLRQPEPWRRGGQPHLERGRVRLPRHPSPVAASLAAGVETGRLSAAGGSPDPRRGRHSVQTRAELPGHAAGAIH